MEWSWYNETHARQAKQNAVKSKLKSCAGCLFILHTHLTRASHPPAAFKHLILISIDKEHFVNSSVFDVDLFEHNTGIEKAALHLSINRGTRSIVTSITVEGVHSASLAEGLPRASWSRARAHQPGTDAVFQQLPTVTPACGNNPITSNHFLNTVLHLFNWIIYYFPPRKDWIWAGANICEDDGATVILGSQTEGTMRRSHDSIVTPILGHRRGMRVSFYPIAYCTRSIVYNFRCHCDKQHDCMITNSGCILNNTLWTCLEP